MSTHTHAHTAGHNSPPSVPEPPRPAIGPLSLPHSRSPCRSLGVGKQPWARERERWAPCSSSSSSNTWACGTYPWPPPLQWLTVLLWACIAHDVRSRMCAPLLGYPPHWACNIGISPLPSPTPQAGAAIDGGWVGMCRKGRVLGVLNATSDTSVMMSLVTTSRGRPRACWRRRRCTIPSRSRSMGVAPWTRRAAR